MNPRRIRIVTPLLLAACLLLFAPISLAGIYKYQREDGTWVYTDNPADLPAEQQNKTAAGQQATGGRDLAERLVKKLAPSGDIEKAVLATVTVQSQIGSGTGFFVTAQGHIITNKHVIRSTQAQKETREKAYEQIEQKIEAIKASLEQEQEKIQANESHLEAVRNQIHPSVYRSNRKKIEQWRGDLEKRKIRLRRDIAAYRDQQQELEDKIGAVDLNSHFTITLADKTELYVSLIAESAEKDLALLKLDGYTTPFLEPQAAESLRLGSPVYAIGNPVGLHNAVSSGVFSGFQSGFLQTDAKIYPGNSGGPLVNQEGRVLGINTFKQITRKFEGLGFAIPISAAMMEFQAYLAGHL